MENAPSDQALWQGTNLQQETRPNWLSTKCKMLSFFFAAPLSLDASVLRFVAFRESKRDFWLSSGNYYSEKLKTLRTHHRESVMRGYLLTTYANLLWMLTDCNLCVIIFFS